MHNLIDSGSFWGERSLSLDLLNPDPLPQPNLFWSLSFSLLYSTRFAWQAFGVIGTVVQVEVYLPAILGKMRS